MKKVLRQLALMLMIAVSMSACGTGAGNSDVNKTEQTDKKDENKQKDQTQSTEQNTEKKVTEKTVFVPMEWVKSCLDKKVKGYENVVLVEGSWGKTAENEEYLKAHLPGAIHINTDDLEHDSEPGVQPKDNYNIKDGKEVEKVLLANGITKDSKVVVYGSTVGASRVAFILLWAGVEDVKLMDGNVAAWQKAGYPVESGEVKATAQTAFGTTVPAHPEWVVDDKTVYEHLNDSNFKLISIRSLPEYRGETSGYAYIDYAGEPKGALWGHAGSDAYHMEDYMDKDGKYVSYEKVLSYMKDINVTEQNESAFYCGTGWRASIPWLILHENGWKNVKLYDGGWWQWLTNPDYPVQLGDPSKGQVKEVKVKDLEPGKAVKK